jgi:amino acid efflux transporter
LLVAAVSEMDLKSSVLLATGSFTLVYVIGTASAIRLLPRGSGRRARSSRSSA